MALPSLRQAVEYGLRSLIPPASSECSRYPCQNLEEILTLLRTRSIWFWSVRLAFADLPQVILTSSFFVVAQGCAFVAKQRYRFG